jgi:ferredoxin
VPSDDEALFGFAVGPASWRRQVNEPRTVLVRIRRSEDDPYEVVETDPTDGVEPVAWIGVRGCDLAAMGITDRVFLDGNHPDPHYRARREAAFIVTVDCGRPGGTCFCVSMGTGPAAEGPADIRVTEICDGDRHEFVCRAGTDAGTAVLDRVRSRPAVDDDLAVAEQIVADAARHMGRTLETRGLRERLQASLEDPHWDDVASRCLSCTNCTMVCPTCFCSNVEDTTDLAGTEATRTRVWDSCFTLDHSHVYGGSVHASTRSRYRQWLTHKLDTWWDQFDTSGCVGCGRCITWCPVGIDITEEAAALGRTEAPQ